MSIYDEVAELTNGYYVPKDNYGQSSNVDKYKKIKEEGAISVSDYNSYFTLSTRELVATRNDTEKRQDIYKENLSPLSKDELINIAIEGHKNYQWANDLAYERGLEIEQLKTEIQSQKDTINYYNNIAYNSKVVCFITICVCSFRWLM